MEKIFIDKEDPELIQKIADEMSKMDAIGLDIETTALLPLDGRIRSIQLNTGKSMYMIDLFYVKEFRPILDVLHNPDRLTGIGHPIVVAQGSSFEQKWLFYFHGVELWPIFDTLHSSYLIYNDKEKKYNLYAIYDRELDYVSKLKDESLSDWSAPVLSQSQIDYAFEDVEFMLTLRNILKDKLKSLKLIKVALTEFEAILPQATTELNGSYLDKEEWVRLIEKKQKDLKTAKTNLLMKVPGAIIQSSLLDSFGFDNSTLKTFDYDRNEKNSKSKKKTRNQILQKNNSDFNPESTAQVLEVCKELEIKDKSGNFLKSDTNESMSEYIHHPFVRALLEYREIFNQLKTHNLELLSKIHPITGRIHGQLNPCTAVGFYSMREPSLVSIPNSYEYRKCFTAEPGNLLLIADMKQCQPRILADIIEEDTLTRCFTEGADPYLQMASDLFNVKLQDVTPTQRKLSKNLVLGICFGMSPLRFVGHCLLDEVRITEKEAESYIDRFTSKYYGIRRWQYDTFTHIKPKGYVRTKSGRIRYLDPSKHHNEFLTTQIQEIQSICMKRAFSLLYQSLKPYKDIAKISLLVHDEFIIELSKTDKDSIDTIANIVKESIRKGFSTLVSIPMEVEITVGKSRAAKLGESS